MNYDLSADGGLVHYTEKFNKHYKQWFQWSDIVLIVQLYEQDLWWKGSRSWNPNKDWNNGENK